MTNKMIPFKHRSHRLSGEDIKNILEKCRICFNITSRGKHIYSIFEILSLVLPRSKKTAIIINTHDHWLSLLIFNNKFCLIVDSLNEVQNWPDVMTCISTFCKNNHLKMFLFKCKFQLDSTQICGSLVCYTIYKFSMLSFLGFLKLRETFSQNSISTNERAMMRKVHQHFKIK